MTKYTTEDYHQALLGIAYALRDRLTTVAHTPLAGPADWHAELPNMRTLLDAIELTAANWQETIDHEAELDRQAENEENSPYA